MTKFGNALKFALLAATVIAPAGAFAQYGGGADSFSLERWEDARSPYASFSLSKDDPSSYVSFGGQARYRFDYFNNPTFGPGTNDEDGFHLTRYLVHADAHVNDHLRAFVQLDSSFVDGRTGGGRYGDAQHLDLQQAFVDLNTSSDQFPYAMLRIGRQELIYGAERLISPDDWRNVRRSFDGAKLSVSVQNNTTDVFVVRPVVIERDQFDNDDNGTWFAGIYNATALPDIFRDANSKLETYLLYLSQTRHATFTNTGGPNADADTYTLGVRFSTKPAPWDFDVEADYQFGQYESDEIAAWSIATAAGYTMESWTFSPRASVGLDAASGSPFGSGRFNQLFPPTYTYLGHIYLFGRPNVIDAHAGLDFHFNDKLALYAAQHIYWRQNTNDGLYNLNGGVTRADTGGIGGSDASYIGNEFDIVLTYQFNKYLSAYIGYAHFFTGDFIQETGPSRDVDFLYGSVTFTF